MGSIDMVFLGTQINIETAVLSLCKGYVIIKGLVVNNPEPPEGKEQCYTSPYLLKVEVMSVKLNLWRVIKTRGKDIEIHEIILTGLDLIYEKGQGRQPSNVDALLDFLKGSKDDANKEGSDKEGA